MSEIHTTPSERLVMMANQIARAFAAQGEARAVPKIAEHIKSFWDPRMRRMIAGHVAAGGAGLQPLALAALKQLEAKGGAPAAGGSGTEAAGPVPAQAHAHEGGRWKFRLPGFSRTAG